MYKQVAIEKIMSAVLYMSGFLFRFAVFLPSSAQDPAPAGLSLALFSAFPHPPGQVVK
jgi:hypothetical protein